MALAVLTWWLKVIEPLATSFAKPFAEQIAALRLRLANQVGTKAWDDLVHAEHERAFVVAGAMKADLLADLAKAVERAIGEHRSLGKFRAEFRQIVADRGWHGWTGEGTPKGEAWRTRVIYKTNMATSYAAGRMAQLVRLNYPFWVYKHGNALEPRLQHLAWDGVALPPDHPFWATHAPPNGWGCTCEIRGARTAAGIRRAKGDPGKTLPDGWQTVNPKTGTPVGIDKGWGYKVGGSVADDINALVAQKAGKLPPEIARDFQIVAATIVPEVLAPSPSTFEDAIALGKRALVDIRANNEDLDAAMVQGDYDLAAPALRDALFDAMRKARSVGQERIALAGRPTREAVQLMRDVGGRLPSDWVRAANLKPLRVSILQGRGFYSPQDAKIVTDTSSTALHEYVHHLQFSLPGLDDLFQALHRMRTAGDPLEPMFPASSEFGRPDHYYRAYQGKEYSGRNPALEVLTMALQPLLGWDYTANRMLIELMKKDPEMLEMAIGVLLHWRL